MSEFVVDTSYPEDNIAMLNVQGFLDAHTFEDMEKAVEEVFQKGVYKLVVLLGQVTYISSAGAGVFIAALGKAQENGGNVILVSPTDNVKEVFDLLGLTQIFTFASNPQEGIKGFE